MKHFSPWRVALLIGIVLTASRPALALQADELLLICNANLQASMRSADFYAKARLVPDGRILAMNLPASEEIPFDKYESEFVPTVRAFLRKNGLETKVKCVVTFFGVPFRIAGKTVTPAENQEIVSIRQELDAVSAKVIPAVLEVEGIAKDLNPAFISRAAPGPNEMADRANNALLDINHHLPRADDPRQPKLLPRIVQVMKQFGGDSLLASKLTDAELTALSDSGEASRWPARRKEVDRANQTAEQLQEKRYDADARKTLRSIVADNFGLFGQLGALSAQLEYLQNDGTAAALDNELALLWWNYYSRSKWITNPLHFRYIGGTHPVMLMVCRLDGPQEGTANQIVLGSLKAERDGLKGKVVVDSTGGTGPGGAVDRAGGYREFDNHLLKFADLIRAKTKLPLTLDRKPAILGALSVRDVAIYTGWYSVRNYVPACTFVPGAVAYHIASFEMVSLRADNEKGWVAGLLNDGVAATIGSVAEPYLGAFPLPDDFFPLLLTGKLTLAECYWKTTPMASWMMVCVGDPLYTPYKNDPQLKVEDLPESLKRAFLAPGQTGAPPTLERAPAPAPAPTLPPGQSDKVNRDLSTPPPPA